MQLRYAGMSQNKYFFLNGPFCGECNNGDIGTLEQAELLYKELGEKIAEVKNNK